LSDDNVLDEIDPIQSFDNRSQIEDRLQYLERNEKGYFIVYGGARHHLEVQ
jgi:hypothetical protein